MSRPAGRWPLIATAVAVIATSAVAVGLSIGPSAGAGESLFTPSATPSVPVDPDTGAVELGMRFTVSVPGVITGMRYFGTPANTGEHTGHLWTGDGERLASARFSDESGTGWQSADFNRDVHVDPGTTYVVSYVAPNGHYAADPYGFAQPRDYGHISATRGAGVYTYGENGGFPTHHWLLANYFVDVSFTPDTGDGDSSGPSATGSTTPTTAPPTSPPATSAAPSATPSDSPTATGSPTRSTPPTTSAPPPPSTSAPAATGDFPDSSNTGVPAGIALTPYTGSCRLTTPGTVIEAKTVNCSLTIATSGVTIKDSVINGTVANDENSNGFGFTISDSEVRVGDTDGTGIGAVGFTAVRVEVTGGNRSMNCWRDCTIRDSYVHGQFKDETGVFHESGIRMGSGGTIVHNTITCDAPDVPPDAGCSAGLTGYGDFGPVEDNLIQNNLFPGTTGGTCAYGGSSGGKPYSDDANNNRFIDNVFEPGRSGNCGFWAPIMDFDRSAPGNVWSGNVWSTGGSVPAG